jgi:transcriptional repressor NrdR
MDCPGCKYPDTRVIETRQDGNDRVRRRRQCMRCGHRVTTEELVASKKKKESSRDAR